MTGPATYYRQRDLVGRQRTKSRPAVKGRLPFSAATLWRRNKTGLFCPPIRISAGVVAWIADEVHAIEAAWAAGKTEDEIRALVAELVEARSKAA